MSTSWSAGSTGRRVFRFGGEGGGFDGCLADGGRRSARSANLPAPPPAGARRGADRKRDSSSSARNYWERLIASFDFGQSKGSVAEVSTSPPSAAVVCPARKSALGACAAGGGGRRRPVARTIVVLPVHIIGHFTYHNLSYRNHYTIYHIVNKSLTSHYDPQLIEYIVDILSDIT